MIRTWTLLQTNLWYVFHDYDPHFSSTNTSLQDVDDVPPSWRDPNNPVKHLLASSVQLRQVMLDVFSNELCFELDKSGIWR